jgi:16S rRNA (adenine(1408)-N(1))-methyltransferase
MAETSRRAAASTKRGGLDNVLFVLAGVERPPFELCGIADEVTIYFPWGSLLSGALALEQTPAEGIASFVRPGGRVVAFVSVAERDRLGIPPLDDATNGIAERWSSFGLRLDCLRRATRDETVATGSTWAKRLTTDIQRPIWRLDLVRLSRSNDGPATPR